MSRSEDDAPLSELRVASLMALGQGIAHRRAAKAGMADYAEELGDLAIEGLVKAIVRYDPSKGPLEPFATAWMRDEVKKGIEKEQKRRLREPHLEDVIVAHPKVAAEERAAGAVDALLSLYACAELSSNGEARLLSAEAMAFKRRAIEELPARDRRLVMLHYDEGLTWKEVVQELDIDERTAQKWDARIRAHLHEQLLAWEQVRPLGKKKP